MKSDQLILSIALFFLSLTANAENQAKAVNMLIDVVAWGHDIRGLSLGKPPTGGDLIHAQAFRYGEPVDYQGLPLLAIYQGATLQEQDEEISAEEEKLLARPLFPMETEASPTDGAIPKQLAERRKLEPSLVALIPLPASSRRITLLLAPGPQGTFHGHIIDDDPTLLPVGKLRVHNLSPNEIALQFGRQKETHLKPRDAFFVDTNGKFAAYRLAYRLEDKWKMQESNVLPLRPNEQCQMIVLRSNNPFFLSSDGGRSGYMQMVILRRRL